MPELELLEHYKAMRKNNIMLDFQGAISQEVLVEMVELLKNKFSHGSCNSHVSKKIFSIFIEMAQNITKYSAERSHLDDLKKDVGAGIIVITEVDKNYTITSGNLVEKQRIPGIIEHCRKINLMNKEELKQYYKKQIKSDREEGKEGAGLGLIAIARKSGNPIIYKMTPIDDVNSFLILSAKIQEEKNG
jgi:hypothetical protein